MLEVCQFARDASVAEAWLVAQEPYVASRDLGHNVDEVEKLLKRHEAFEKSTAAWEERFSALERLTTVRRFSLRVCVCVCVCMHDFTYVGYVRSLIGGELLVVAQKEDGIPEGQGMVKVALGLPLCSALNLHTHTHIRLHRANSIHTHS